MEKLEPVAVCVQVLAERAAWQRSQLPKRPPGLFAARPAARARLPQGTVHDGQQQAQHRRKLRWNLQGQLAYQVRIQQHVPQPQFPGAAVCHEAGQPRSIHEIEARDPAVTHEALLVHSLS